jgi:hypothetical protein
MNLGLLPKLNNGCLKVVNTIIMKNELNHFNIKEKENTKNHQRGCGKSCSIYVYITGQKEKMYWSEVSQVVPAHPSGKGKPEAT